MRIPMLSGLAALVVALSVAVPTSGTVTLPVDLDGLATYSSEVFVGRVVDVRSHWSPDRTRILTTTTFTDAEFLKGNGPRDGFTLTLPGGEIGEIGMAVPGTPRFEPGQRTLLFLNRDEAAWMMPVVGWSQGRFHLQDGAVYTDAGDAVVDVSRGRLVVGIDDGQRMVAGEGLSSAGVPGHAHGAFRVVQQHPDREEPLPEGAVPERMRTDRERPVLQEFGGGQAGAPPVGQGPMVLTDDSGHGGPMGEAAFLEIVRELIAAAQ